MARHRRIHKKLWPERFRLLKSNRMQLDVRLADFRCRPGDVLVFDEWNPRSRRYTGRSLERTVGALVKFNLAKLNSLKDIARYGHYFIWLED